jgi:hypothetical protein
MVGKRTTGKRGRPLRKQPDVPRVNMDRLALWRAQRAGIPAAVAAWKRFSARTDELKLQWALERYGIPLDQCDHPQRQQLQTEVLDVAIAEL